MDMGLAAESQEQFYATTFGGRLNTLLENIPELPTFYLHEVNVTKKISSNHYSVDPKPLRK